MKLAKERCANFLTIYFTVFTLLIVDGILSQIPDDIIKTCEKKEFIRNESSYVLEYTPGILNTTLSNQFSSSCDMYVTNPGLRLRASISYKPTESGCDDGYIRLGNDVRRPDKESLTSYQFCDHVNDVEVISKSNALWIMMKRRFNKKVEGQIIMDSLKPVFCNTSEYQCSPVECVPMTSLCDGKKDCSNGRDEFCDKQNYNNCFLCDSGSPCISPTLPRYSYDWGKPFWYMCDGVDHCLDGSDERQDKCQKPWRLYRDLHVCHSHSGTKYYTWKQELCDTKECSLEDGCSEEVVRKYHTTSFIIPISAFSLIISCGVCFFMIIGKRRRDRHRRSEVISSRCQIYRDTTSDELPTQSDERPTAL